MSTWRLLSDADNNFRWEVSGSADPQPQPEPYVAKPPPPTLPSMADLIHQGHSKILENRDTRFAASPLFRKASGGFVVPKQSSVSKALSVLSDENNADAELEKRPDGCGLYTSLFQTASGKKVSASSAAIARAKTFLEQDDDASHHPSFQGFQSIKGDVTCDTNGLTHLKKRRGSENAVGTLGVTSLVQNYPLYRPDLPSNGFFEDSYVKHAQADVPTTRSAVETPPIKFHTAGGRSISVSADALKRARSLLGDPEQGALFDKVGAADTVFPVLKESNLNLNNLNQENVMDFSHTYKEVEGRKHDQKAFNSFSKTSSRTHLADISMGKNSADKSHNLNSSVENLLSEKSRISGSALPDSSENGASRISSLKTSSRGTLHTSTSMGTTRFNGKQGTGDLQRIGRKNHVSSFKRPRCSKFTNPLNHSIPLVPSGLSNRERENSCYKKRVSTLYPAQNSRVYIKEFFKVPPTPPLSMNLPDEVRQINSGNAEMYVFREDPGVGWIGVDDFHGKLVQSGASLQYASKEWVANHYKWIVWKLASYDRLSSSKCHGKFLSVSNVLEELKYRYEREVNHGHRSAIKKILEGDASPSSVLILCISTVCHDNNAEAETGPVTIDESESGAASTIELTDGWYSVNARLDVVLSKYLALGKLFVGQKLRISGSRLCGWTQPVSPLQAPKTISLLLHANGTYRACWADRLGFSRESSIPLAFTCIKSSGGPVPRVLVGVTRIYPVLYRERVGNEGCIVRSEKEEAEVAQLYNQRCSNIVEGVMSDFCRGNYGSGVENDHDSEEGAKILKMLENAFEPEVLMAEMSPEKLASVTNYQAKLESRRQQDIERSVKKALEDAKLSTREVTPFMRLRVVGLTYQRGQKGNGPKEGLITIWNPNEKQQVELVEGQAYAMCGLVPLHSNSSTLFLHGRGPTLNWQPLASSERECFESFFTPRESVLLSKLVEVPQSSEFDTAVLVLYVGKEYVAGHQKRQWVFVTDGSTSEESTSSLLAINFCSSCSDDYAVSPFNGNLVGSIVGFCNLIKRSKDEMNDLWVAEATANTTYHLNYDYTRFSHLNQAFASLQKWKNRSSMIVEKLRKKVLFIVGDSKT